MNTAVTPVPILEATPANTPPTPELVLRPPAGDAAPEPSFRLVIEESETGAFIYKTLDRVTGEVVRQFPREEVVRMMADEAYAAGDVIETEA